MRPTARLLFGTGPMRIRSTQPIIHASQRPPEKANVKFSELGLQFIPKPIEIVKTVSAYSPPPSSPPDLPFTVSK